MRSEAPNSLLMRAAVPRSTTHWRAAFTPGTVRSFFVAKRLIGTVSGAKTAARRKRAVEAGLAGRLAVTVPARAPVTGHAGRAVDEAFFGDRVADPDVKTGVVDLVGLRSLETVIDVGRVPFRRVDHRGQRRGFRAGRIAATRLPVGCHVGLG